jgi:hypothetical protein
VNKLPPITQALADAITEAQLAQASAEANLGTLGEQFRPDNALAPIGSRPIIRQTYPDAGPEAQHIQLIGGRSALELYMAFVQAGADVPPSIVRADVILSAGAMDIYAEAEDGLSTWVAQIGGSQRRWTWQTC